MLSLTVYAASIIGRVKSTFVLPVPLITFSAAESHANPPGPLGATKTFCMRRLYASAKELLALLLSGMFIVPPVMFIPFA